MSIFNIFKQKNKIVEINDEDEKMEINENKNSIIEMSNYMLSDIRKEDIIDNSYKLPIDKLSELSPIIMPTVNTITTIIGKHPVASEKVYRITNLGKNDSLKSLRDGNLFWGAIKKSDGTNTLAKLKEVNPTNILSLDPAMLMMSATLYSIESELGEIKELTKKIMSFLENEKHSQIESDLELLKKIMIDLKYSSGDEKYMAIYHNQVMDILRTSSANLILYKKEIKDKLSKVKLFTTDNSMKSILNEIQGIFKYYRLSLYIYSFSTYISIFLAGNYKSDYLLHKRDELSELINEYNEEFKKTIEYIQKNASKLLEGNVLSGIGSAGKTIGNIVEKVKASNADKWLNEKSTNLIESGETIKHNYVNKFEEMKDTNSKIFITQIEKINSIYNKTAEIYFDKENIYFQMPN